MKKLTLFVIWLGLLGLDAIGAPQLTLNKGDHIAYIGNTLADRMQHHGFLETLIYAKFPRHDLVFRNLAASGDEDAEIDGVVDNLHRMLERGGVVLVGHHLPKQMSFGRFIRSLDDARALFEPRGFALRVALDITNEFDRDHAGDPVGRSIYFLAHTVQRT